MKEAEDEKKEKNDDKKEGTRRTWGHEQKRESTKKVEIVINDADAKSLESQSVSEVSYDKDKLKKIEEELIMKKKAEEVLEPDLQENDASIKNKKKVKAFFIL